VPKEQFSKENSKYFWVAIVVVGLLSKAQSSIPPT